MKRTNYCGEITAALEGTKQTLCGWVHGYRNHGGVLFIDLRDRTGFVQLVVGPENKEAFEEASSLRNEYVVRAQGVVARRKEGYVNKNIPTGEVEIIVDKIETLNTCVPLPFDIDTDKNISEDIRLKYRYLDLRNARMVRNLTTRHRLAQVIRHYFDEHGFLEVETPILTRSTPEGARDYLVPSRVHNGKFYALPQSPQMFKQTLMASGIDRYFQLARAFRDEDLRADRQPEHTQVDIEMSFVELDDIFEIAEGMMQTAFKAVGEETKRKSAFMNVEAWRKNENAESFSQLTKGTLLTIEGYFKPEEWADKDGVLHNNVVMVATKFYPAVEQEEAPEKPAKKAKKGKK